MNEYTQEALEYLQNSVITPAKETIATGAVTEAQYNAYVALYNQFQMMERTGVAQSLSEEYYYYIHNIWFGGYAGYNSNSNVVSPLDKSNSDNILWSIVKKPNGQVYIYNKATGTAAYPAAYNGEQGVKLGQEYAWTLEERNIEGKTGICIIDNSGTNAWYSNRNSWNFILMKPFWGACTWEFQKSDIATSIVEVEDNSVMGNSTYDLLGNRLEKIVKPGIYIVNGEKRIVK